MIPTLAARGYNHGSGVIDPGGSRFIINIPKNASSYVLDWANHNGWRPIMADQANRVQEMIVILRDPVERWISGIAQYVNTYILSVCGPNGPVFCDADAGAHAVITPTQFVAQYNEVVDRLVFDVISGFDDHVWPQCEIIRDVLPGVDRKYFRLEQVDLQLGEYLHWQSMQHLDRNSGQDIPNIAYLQNFFEGHLKSRQDLRERVQRHYADDYRLLEEVFHDA